MKLKYLAIAFVIFFLVLGAVSALDNVKYNSKDVTVPIGGFDFTFPAGYGPVPEQAVHTYDNGVKKDGEIYVNAEEDMLAAFVFSGNINHDLESYVFPNMVEENQTINGHDGILFHELGYYNKYFVYEDNGSVVLVQANTMSEMEDMIPK